MRILRIVFLIIILATGIGLGVLLGMYNTRPPLVSSYAPAFQYLGLTFNSANRLLSRVLPVDDLDEKEFGDILADSYAEEADTNDPQYIRLNQLMAALLPFSKKPFAYRVFVLNQGAANAFALPGGVIIVNRRLCDLMSSDGEITAILAHEMGHIELEHCFAAVRFELLSRKWDAAQLLTIMDFAVNFLLRYSYGKYQENEADDYAFALLLESAYNPHALSLALARLLAESEATPPQAEVVRDYLMSHPPLEIRIEKYAEKASLWWKAHPLAVRKP